MRLPSASMVFLLVKCWYGCESTADVQYSTTVFATQSKQSAKLFLQSPVFGIGAPPTLHPLASVPPPRVLGGRGTLAGERGAGRVLSPTRGHLGLYNTFINTFITFFLPCGTYTVVLFIYTYFVGCGVFPMRWFGYL
jgi:hypothetical protein